MSHDQIELRLNIILDSTLKIIDNIEKYDPNIVPENEDFIKITEKIDEHFYKIKNIVNTGLFLSVFGLTFLILSYFLENWKYSKELFWIGISLLFVNFILFSIFQI